MSQTNSAGSILDQEAQLGDAIDQPGIDYPFTQDEIDDLLYSETGAAADRLARLLELRDQITARRSAEWMGDDPQNLLGEIERAIQNLQGASRDDEEREYSLDETVAPTDPLDHRETLAPDDDELLDALDAEAALDAEQDGGEAVLDESEWTKDQDGFRPERGVH